MRKLNVLLLGWNGVDNTGSEAKLLVTIRDVKEVLGDRLGKLYVLVVGPSDERRYVKDPDVEIISLFPLFERGLEVLYRLIWGDVYDIVLLCEGSTFLDTYHDGFLWLFLLAARLQHLRGRHTVSYSNDCSPMKFYNASASARTLNRCIDLIMVRNPDAKKRMIQYGVTKEIHVTADGAYLYPTPPEEYRRKLLEKLNIKKQPIAVAPKEFWGLLPITPKLYPKEGYQTLEAMWKREYGYAPLISSKVYLPSYWLAVSPVGKELSERFKRDMARFCDYLIERFDTNVLLIGMAAFEGDCQNAKEIMELMKHKDEARWIPSFQYNVDDIKSLLVESRFLITTRYHASVLSSSAGVPMIAISSDSRLEAVFRELNLMDFYIPVTVKPPQMPENLYELLVEKMNQLAEREQEIRERIKKQDKVFVERALQNRELFRQWVKQTFGD
jgi:polysaccharide pyruvyl transferase WcaK-like protein